jgi:hypothetical protein
MENTIGSITVMARFPRYRYICERHGEIGRDDGMTWGAATISYDGYAPGELRCQKCYWENVIVPNCGLVTKEEIK